MNGYEARKDRKRRAILSAAGKLFERIGVAKVSVEEIAREAGVNPVTVYNHFGNKPALIREVVRSAISEQWAEYSQILAGDRPFLEKLRALILSKVKTATLHEGALFATALAQDEEIRAIVERFFKDEVYPLFEELLREGRRSGEVRGDVSIASIELYLDMFTSLARLRPELFADREGLPKTTAEIWSLFLHGLLGPRASAEPAPG